MSICEKLKSRICQRRNLSDATEALCARLDAGLPALCGKLDVILGSAAADGRVLDLLSYDFDVLPAEDGLAGPVLRPLIVGPADLDDPELIAYLGDTYDAGETVAIVGATQDEADRFQTLVGDGNEANCEPSADSSEIGFYGLHKSITKRPALVSSYCLPGSITGKDRSLRQQFQDYFAPEYPMEPDEVAVEDLGGDDFLEDLATSVHCQATFSDLDLGA